jgi:flagellar hook-associated protein 3 FlgL
MSDNIKGNLTKYQDLQNRISNGGKLTVPSEDPLAYSYMNKMKDARTQIGQYTSISKKLGNDLNLYDGTLSSTSKLLTEIRTVAVRAANSTLDQVDLNNLANEVNEKLRSVVALGNTNIQGKYMYSGSKTTAEPFEVTLDGETIKAVTYTGDSTSFHREVGFNDTIKINYTGEEVFMNKSADGVNIMDEIITLRDAISAGNKEAITGQLEKMDRAQSQVMGYSAVNGNKMKHLENLSTTMEELDIRYAKNEEEVGSLDMATLINALNTQQTSYQATLYIAGQISKVSLLNYV